MVDSAVLRLRATPRLRALALALLLRHLTAVVWALAALEAERRIVMIGVWWWFWVAFMLVFLVSPLGYGWGYRGWGPPVPSYFQRRSGSSASRAQGSSDSSQAGWGLVGDVVWLVAVVGVVWAISATFWGVGRW